MQKTDKIYVAGHQGLVGSALFSKLEADGYCNVITKTFDELDLRRQEQVESFFAQHRPEYVFLAAAKVGGIYANNRYKADFIYDNMMIAANVIHAAYKFGVKKLLNLGSSCIYPKNAAQPLKEEYLLTSSLESTNEPYAIAKIAAIKLCRYYNEQYGTNFISVMPTNLYGPNDNFNLETSHVLPAILRKLHLAKLLKKNRFDLIRYDLQKFNIGFCLNEDWILCSSEKIEKILLTLGIAANEVVLWGSGNVYREFLYVDDLADALVFCMNGLNYLQIGELINIGCGRDLKIRDLVGIIAGIIGFQGEIRFDSSYPDGANKKVLDIEKIIQLGWKPHVNLENGIKKVYNFYQRCEESAQRRMENV